MSEVMQFLEAIGAMTYIKIALVVTTAFSIYRAFTDRS